MFVALGGRRAVSSLAAAAARSCPASAVATPLPPEAVPILELSGNRARERFRTHKGIRATLPHPH
jgi:hypothetical protein